MAIFTLLARLGLDTTEFSAGIKRAQSGAAGLGKSLKGHIGGQLSGIGASIAGAFTVGAVTGFVGELVHMADEIRDVAELLGVSTDEVQRLQKAANDAGQSFGSIVTAFQRIEGMRAKALTGDSKALSLFSILGIDPSKGSGIEVMRQAVEASKSGVYQNAAAFELLGKKVTGLKLVMDELRTQGPIKLISDDDLRKLDEANKKLEEAKRQMMASSAPVATAGMRYISGFLDSMSEGFSNPDDSFGAFPPVAAYRGAMKAADLEIKDGERFGALPLPSGRSAATTTEDPTALLRRIAVANEKTMEAITQNVQR